MAGERVSLRSPKGMAAAAVGMLLEYVGCC